MLYTGKLLHKWCQAAPCEGLQGYSVQLSRILMIPTLSALTSKSMPCADVLASQPRWRKCRERLHDFPPIPTILHKPGTTNHTSHPSSECTCGCACGRSRKRCCQLSKHSYYIVWISPWTGLAKLVAKLMLRLTSKRNQAAATDIRIAWSHRRSDSIFIFSAIFITQYNTASIPSIRRKLPDKTAVHRFWLYLEFEALSDRQCLC